MQNSRTRIKILHLIESLAYGGAEKMLLTYLTHLDKEKFESVVLYLYNDASLLPEVKNTGVDVYSANLDSIFHPLSALSKISRVVKDDKIDIIHTNLFGADIYGRIAGKLSNVRGIVTTLHNIGYESKSSFRNRFFFERRRVLDGLTGRLLNNSFIAVSNSVKESAEKFLGFKNIRVIYNSVDTEIFNPLSDKEREETRGKLGIRKDCFLLVIVGRLDIYKGHRFLLEALARNEFKNRDFVLFIVGLGSCEQELKKQAEALGIDEKVLFLGYRRDVNSIVGCADAFVLPSISEGFPMSLLEAMALKVPCIASRIGGIGELIENGKTGLLVDPVSVDSLSDAVLKLISDPPARATMALNGYNRVISDFNIIKNVKLLENLYESCLNQNVN